MMYEIPVQQGWQCPLCKRIYSPTTYMCFYCGGDKTETSTTYTVKGSTGDFKKIPYINICSAD